jgi:hypothetical protein
MKTLYDKGRWRVDSCVEREGWIEIANEEAQPQRGPGNIHQLRRNLNENKYALAYKPNYVLSTWVEKENVWKAVSFFATRSQAAAVAAALELASSQIDHICKFEKDLYEYVTHSE